LAPLLWTLEIALGSNWDKDMAEAWKTAYDILAKAMIAGADAPEPRRVLAKAAA
jgi:hemoglobin-like flavoprotein